MSGLYSFPVCSMFSIADQKTPRDRLVQVVRWYLSAFHAGRKSGVAKKPYNPILGETFRCYYELPGIDGAEQVFQFCSCSCGTGLHSDGL